MDKTVAFLNVKEKDSNMRFKRKRTLGYVFAIRSTFLVTMNFGEQLFDVDIPFLF